MQELDKYSALPLSPASVTAVAPPPRLPALRTHPKLGLQKPLVFSGVLANQILTSIPGPDFARLLPFIEPVSLAAGDDILKYGESPEFVYFPETAVISHLHLLEDGSTTAATIIGKEGMVGLTAIFDSRPAPYWSHVTVGGTAMRISAAIIQKEFARGTAVQRILLAYAYARLTQLSQQAVCNGRHLMFGRLCTWLLMVHERAGEQVLRLTHERIAQHLGARRAGITSACNQLRAEAVIKYQRGLIVVLDKARLAAMACECYGTMRSSAA